MMRCQYVFSFSLVLILIMFLSRCDCHFDDHDDHDDGFMIPLKFFKKPSIFKKKYKEHKYVLKPYKLKRASLKDKIKDKVSIKY